MMYARSNQAGLQGERSGQCPNCDEETIHGTAGLEFTRQGIAFSLAGVPADVCPNCGEAYIDPRLAKPLWDYATTAMQQIIQFTSAD